MTEQINGAPLGVNERLKFSRRKAIVCSMALLVVCAMGGLAIIKSLRVSTSDASQIRSGMSKAEVIAILGTPLSDVPVSWNFLRFNRWDANDGYIYVAFDNSDCVEGVSTELVSTWTKLKNKILCKLGLRPDTYMFVTQLTTQE